MPRKSKFEEEDLFSTSSPSPDLNKKDSKKNLSHVPQKDTTPLRLAEEAAAHAWKEKIWEFDLTMPSQAMKDAMKASMLQEGFGKREANKVFKGLFFKEKVCNTRTQALEYLETVPTSYGVKYKIGIAPSPQMVSLEKRLHDKEERLKSYTKEQTERDEKKFGLPFITCPHCHSRVNRDYIHLPLCPVCGKDLHTDTIIKTMASLEEAVKDLKKRYEDTARKYNSKFTGGEKWIIRLVNPLYEED